jgi:O-antigen biosynthesis protein WbqP
MTAVNREVLPLSPDVGRAPRREPAVYAKSKRAFDLVLAILLLPAMVPFMAVIAVFIKLTSKGPVLYWSDRVGINCSIFRMPKFRTMRLGTPALATHLMSDPERYLTPIGPLLRRTSLDELPQLFSVIAGKMSFVGPRPALFNQDDLVALRRERGIDRLMPGITGWAQVNGRDELPIPVKVEYEYEYMRRCSFLFDLRILALTLAKAVRSEGVSH